MESIHSTYLDNRTNTGSVESWFIDAATDLLHYAATLEVPAPFYLAPALLNVRGLILTPHLAASGGYREDRQHLLLPKIPVEDVSLPATTLFRPIFDLISNACGLERSPRYSAQGDYVRPGI
jgi:hypothetical protein